MLIPWSYLSHQAHGKQLLSQLLGAAREWEGIKAAVSGAGLRGTGRRGLCQHAAVCVCDWGVAEVQQLQLVGSAGSSPSVIFRWTSTGNKRTDKKKRSPGKLQAWDGHRVPASRHGPLGCCNPVRCTASPHCSAPHSQDAAPATPVPTAASRPAPRAAGGLGGGEGRGVSEAPDGSGAARHRVTPPCPEVRRQRRWSGGQRPGCTGAASGRSATGGELGAVRCGQRWGSAPARPRRFRPPPAVGDRHAFPRPGAMRAAAPPSQRRAPVRNASAAGRSGAAGGGLCCAARAAEGRARHPAPGQRPAGLRERPLGRSGASPGRCG